MVHFFMRYFYVVAFLIIQAAAWRFGNQWWGLGGSIALLILAMIQNARLPNCWRSHQALCYAFATLISLAGIFPAIWPCELGCSHGQAFSVLYQIPVLWIAVSTYAVCTIILATSNPDKPNILAHTVTWIVFGNSLFFLGLSAYLNMLCPICLSVHTCILAAAIFSWAVRRSLLLVIVSTLAGAGLIGGAYYIQEIMNPAPAVIEPQAANNNNAINNFMQMPVKTGPVDQDLIKRINAGRSIGSDDAAFRLSIFVQLGCNHCATVVPLMANDATTLSKDLPLQVRFHFFVNRHDNNSIDRHYMCWEAGLDGKYLQAQIALLGNEALSFGFKESLAEVGIDADDLRQRYKKHKVTYDALAAQDMQLYTKSKYVGTTPIVLLYKGDELIGNWDAKESWAGTQEAIHQTIEQHR